ncbi:hypothetical protein ACFLYS_02820, partial [Chloroflexota bacterium]
NSVWREIMAKTLGKMEKPEADKFNQGRRLLFVPLIFTPMNTEKELSALIEKYWKQAHEQLDNLQSKMSSVKKIYHELITPAAEEGRKAIERLNTGSYAIVKAGMDKGAELQPIEDEDIMMEFMDWSRCISIGLQSQKAFSKIYQSYQEAQKNRDEHIARRLDETLKSDEIGILFMQEGHRVQFPPDVQVFYIVPPSLDEINHWQKKPESEVKPQAEDKPKKKKSRAKKEK